MRREQMSDTGKSTAENGKGVPTIYLKDHLTIDGEYFVVQQHTVDRHASRLS